MAFLHGVRVQQRADSRSYIPTTDTATIAVVVTADNADDTTFPLNIPVKIAGFDELTRIAAGSTGTFARVIEGIGSQGYAPLLAVVRVAESADPVEQAANVVAGVGALAAVPGTFDFIPRLLGAPGLDSGAGVVTALGALADKWSAFCYVNLNAVSGADALMAANAITHKRIMPIWPNFTSGGQVIPAAAVALGLRVRIDTEHPQSFAKTLSNVTVRGMDGVTQLVEWDMQGSSTNLASQLNAANVTTIIKSAAAYRFWGNRTASNEVDWQFESSVRIASIIDQTVANAQLARLDQPMSQNLIEDMIEDVRDQLNVYRTAGILINANVWLDPGFNSISQIEQGNIYVHYDFTPPPPLEGITMVSTITNKYLLEALPSWLQTDTGATPPDALSED